MRAIALAVVLSTAFFVSATAAEPADKSAAPVATTPAESSSPSLWAQAARKYNLDPIDLYGIALQESRRHFSDNQVRPWPWTLHTPEEGGLYFDSFEAAAKKLRELIAAGRTNIDIGLMQLSFAWQGYRVVDPVQLLKPEINIEVAAAILREHLDQFGELRLAIARYHSARLDRGIPYAASVLAIIQHLRQLAEVQLALNEG